MVCFDLGGVLARINRCWQHAAETANVTTSLPAEPLLPLTDITCFDAFQAGELGLSDYLDGLGRTLGITFDEALAVHNSILIGPYKGTEQMILALRRAGFQTGCLSNTNAPHWEALLSHSHFPGIAALDAKMASHEAKLQKPGEEIFRHFEATYGLQPKEIVFFDDAAKNILAAAACGWRAHLIDHEVDTAPQMIRALESEGIILI